MPEFSEIHLPASPRKIALGVAAVVVVILIFSIVSETFYSIPADSQAVILRFGRFYSIQDPGLHSKIPLGVDEVYLVPLRRVQSMEFGFQTARAGRRSEYRTTPKQKEASLMLTGDLNMASVEWVVQYRINDPKAFLFRVAEVQDTIRDSSEAVMRTLVGDRSVDEVITSGREALAAQAKERLQKLLEQYGCGVEVVTLTLQDATPPDPVKDAFDAVNRARQEKDQVINQARAERNRLIPAARGDKERKIKEAEGYLSEKVRRVQGETAALLAQYEAYLKAPKETRQRLFMETMEHVYRAAGRTIVLDPAVKTVLPLLDLGSSSQGGAK